jgi:putative protease
LEEEIGKVTHYFSKIGVAAITLTKKLKIGDAIHIKGASSDFEQKVDSMQIDCVAVKEAGRGQEIGLKVLEKVHDNDKVFKKTI